MAYVHKGWRKSLYNPKGDPHKILIEEIGPGFAEYRREWEETTKLELERDYPVQLDIELNVSCNLKCPMCTWSAEVTHGEGKKSWMDFEFYKHIVEGGMQHGLRAVNLNYVNEPLVRRDLPKFVKFARDVGVLEVMFNTNGLLLTDDFTRELIEAGLTKLSFSIDAFSPETYNIVRVGGDYNKLIQIIHRFLEIRAEMGSRLPLLKLTFLKMSANAHELEDFLNYWEDKADLFSIQNLHNPFEGELREQKNVYFVNGPPSTRVPTEIPRCSSPFQRMTVRTNGNVLPCCNMRAADSLVMGNAHKDDVYTIWNSDEMKKIRAMHKEYRYYENPICKACIENSDAWAPEAR
jgi:radical SAM protein with 4Fe4S-binding SPASM domain